MSNYVKEARVRAKIQLGIECNLVGSFVCAGCDHTWNKTISVAGQHDINFGFWGLCPECGKLALDPDYWEDVE